LARAVPLYLPHKVGWSKRIRAATNKGSNSSKATIKTV